MASEEITARFGADTSGFERGRQAMLGGLGQMSREGELHFNKIGKSAHAFKDLLKETTAITPALGNAFRFLMSPVGGFLSMATMGFAALNEKISEMNKDLFEQGSKAAEPIADIVKVLKSGHDAIEKFNQKFNEWKYQPTKDKTTENLEKKVALVKELSQAAIQGGGDKTKIERAATQVEYDLTGKALTTLKGGIGESGKAADIWAGEMRKHLGNRVVENAGANIKQQQDRLGSLTAQQRRVEAEIDSVRNPGPSSPWYFKSQAEREAMGDLMERTRLNPIRNQIAASEGIIGENQSAIDREMRNRELVQGKIGFYQNERDTRQSQFDALTRKQQDTKTKLTLLNNGVPPEHAAELSQPLKNLNDALATQQFNMDSWQYDRDKATQDWRKARGMSWQDVTKPVKPTLSTSDQNQKDANTLNDLLSKVIAGDKLKVTMTIVDE